MPATTSKKPRADALVNRQKILQAARIQFAQEGADGSMNEVARKAGVGVATLYRHFPTREDLVAAVYAEELEALGSAVDDYLATMTPDDALSAWGDRFLEYAATKRGLGEALRAVRERGDMKVDPRSVLIDSLDKLLAAGRAAGTIHADVDAADVLGAFSGLWSFPNDDQYEQRAQRLLALVLGGLRHG